MKIIQSAVIGVCLFTSIGVKAQQTTSDTATKFIPPVIVKDADPATKSEKTKKAYKSKEWHQGDEMMTDTTSGAADKPKTGMQKNMKKLRRPTPPPPPAAPAKPDQK